MTFLLGLFDLWRDVKVALLHPLKCPKDEQGDNGLYAKADVGAKLPAEFGTKKCVDGCQASKIGKASIESDKHASECMRRE